MYSRGNAGSTFGVWLVNPDGSNLRQLANPGLGPAWSRTDAGSTTRRAATTRLTRASCSRRYPWMEERHHGHHRTGCAMSSGRTARRSITCSSGRSSTARLSSRSGPRAPENGPFRVLARISPSRVPIGRLSIRPCRRTASGWPRPSPRVHDQYLGAVDLDWRVASDHGFRRSPDVHRPARVLVIRRAFVLAAVAEGDADIVLLDGLLDSRRRSDRGSRSAVRRESWRSSASNPQNSSSAPLR